MISIKPIPVAALVAAVCLLTACDNDAENQRIETVEEVGVDVIPDPGGQPEGTPEINPQQVEDRQTDEEGTEVPLTPDTVRVPAVGSPGGKE